MLDWRKDVFEVAIKKAKELQKAAEKAGKPIKYSAAVKLAWKEPEILKLADQYRAQKGTKTVSKSSGVSKSKSHKRRTVSKSHKKGGAVRRRRKTSRVARKKVVRKRVRRKSVKRRKIVKKTSSGKRRRVRTSRRRKPISRRGKK